MGKMVAFRRVLLVALILPVLLFVMNGLVYDEFKLNRSDLWFIVFAIFYAAHTQITLLLQSRSAPLQERVSQSGDGWYYLVPSPLQRYRIAVGFLCTALFAGLYLFVEPPPAMAKWLSIVSISITGCLLYRSFGRRTRWNDDRIEQRLLFFRPSTIRFRDVAGIRREMWFEDVYIDGVDGARVLVPVIQIGSQMLIGTIPGEEESTTATA